MDVIEKGTGSEGQGVKVFLGSPRIIYITVLWENQPKQTYAV